jgi:hypothetical protein
MLPPAVIEMCERNIGTVRRIVLSQGVRPEQERAGTDGNRWQKRYDRLAEKLIVVGKHGCSLPGLKSIDTLSLSTAMAVQPFLFALMLRGKELTRCNTSAVRQQPTQSTYNKIPGITSTPARRRTPTKVKPPPIVSSHFRFLPGNSLPLTREKYRCFSKCVQCRLSHSWPFTRKHWSSSLT